MAGGYFTKQADYRNAKFLNDVNDAVLGGQISTLPSGFTQYQQTLPGDRICLDDATALALSDTAVGSLFGGIYMYVLTLSSATANPAVGTIAFFTAASISTTAPSYTVSSDPQPTTTNPGYVCGIFINALTKGNYGWIQIMGVASVLFDSTTLTATTAGGWVFAKASATTAGTADLLTGAASGTHLAQGIGVAIGAAASSTISKVGMIRAFARI